MDDISNLGITQLIELSCFLKNSQIDTSRLVVHPTEGVAHDDA